MKKFHFTLIVSFIILLSCKKTAEKSCELNSANIVGSYKIAAVTYKKNSSTAAIDTFARYSPCKRDDIVTFNSNNTYTYADAGITCSPSGNDSGTWALVGNSLTYKGYIYTVSSFDCKSLTGSYSRSFDEELTTVTLIRQ